MSHKSYHAKKREAFTFDIDGAPVPPFTARGGLGSMVLELGELANLANLEAASPEGMAAIAHVFQMLLGPAEYERFRTYIADNEVDPETLLEVLQDMFVAVVAHPLAPPSDSSPGPTTTPRTYRVISPSDGTVTEMPLTPEREAALLAAMEADLQEIPGSS
jgi:hypothetical protein